MSAVEQIGAISRCLRRCDARSRKLASISIMTLAGRANAPPMPSFPAFHVANVYIAMTAVLH